MFLKHGAKKVDEIELVAPRGRISLYWRSRACSDWLRNYDQSSLFASTLANSRQ